MSATPNKPNPVLKSNVRFIFGIILIACGWVICFNLFMLIFGIPFFLLGTVLVMFSKKSWLVKSLIIGVPIILWIVGFQLILHEIKKKDAVAIVVEHDFSGQVRVVYGEKNGIVPETKDGRMFFEIPANGVLLVKPFIKSGLTDIEYYVLDNKGVKIKITALKSPGEKVAGQRAGYFEGTMSSEPGSPDYIYDAFFILGNDSAKALTYQEEMVKNPLTDSLVKASRGIK
jgi:hypothetical protein